MWSPQSVYVCFENAQGGAKYGEFVKKPNVIRLVRYSLSAMRNSGLPNLDPLTWHLDVSTRTRTLPAPALGYKPCPTEPRPVLAYPGV